jgi:potassium efflux system protein
MFFRSVSAASGRGLSSLRGAVLCNALLCLVVPNMARGQVAEPSAETTITPEIVEARLEEATASQDLSDDDKAEIREIYAEVLEDLETTAEFARQAAVFEEMAATVPARFELTKAELAELPNKKPAEIPEMAALADLEKLLKESEAELEERKADAEELDGEPARRQARRAEIPALNTGIRERLGEIERLLALPAPEGEPLLHAARQTQLRGERRRLEQELETGEKELAAYTAETSEFLNMQRDLAAQKARRAEDRVKMLRDRANLLRQQEADRLAAAASLEEARAHPLLGKEAIRNTELAQQSKTLGDSIAKATDELEKINQELDQIKRDFESVQEKIDRVGLSEGIGLLLRRQLSTLPDIYKHQRQLQIRRAEIRKTELDLINFDDDRSQLRDLDREAVRQLEELSPLPADVSREDLRRALRELLERRRELLDKLIQSGGNYFDLLIQIDASEDELIREVEKYTEYLREHVLWIRSGVLLRPSDISHGGEALVWLLDPRNWSRAVFTMFPYGSRVLAMRQSLTPHSWSEIAAAVGQDIARQPWELVSSILFLVFVIVLSLNQWRLRVQIRELGEQAAKRNCQRFAPTFHALLDTVFISLPWPSVLLFCAWRLTEPSVTDDFARALGYGLGITSVHYFAFDFMRQVCRTQGLAEAHFSWPDEAVKIMRRSTRLILVVTVPLMLVVTTLQGQSKEIWQTSLGRIAYLVGIAFLAVMVFRVLRPHGVFFRAYARDDPEGLLFRLRRVWYWFGMVSLAALLILAFVGFYYTAYELTLRLQGTVWVLFALLILASLVARWLLTSRRKLRIEQVIERRRVLQAQAAASGDDAESIATQAFVADEELDLGEMSQQSSQLLRVALFVSGMFVLWFIWVDVLPALGMLERVHIWEVAVQDGTRWITLEHFVFCLIILVLTTLAVRNLPGVLELTILQRLPLDAGVRYAITTCVRYLIMIIGLIIGFRTIGIEWSQYQWLVAAAGVGLGFGLQEIFANFVSGLIVLIERPVRVGDIVTVEGVTGVVSRIRMRATTVTNWDRQEFIVPNKEFVTGRLLNWTLTNAVNRVVINVGVAYGSDTELARELLLKVAADNENVLDDPAPLATFEGLGDSTLDLVLRCYLPNLDNRLSTIHQLHTEIHVRFAEAGLEIAFPQRDIHIRSLESPIVVDDKRSTKR